MRSVLKGAVLGLVVCIAMGVAAPARAQSLTVGTAQAVTAGATYTFGGESFDFSSCLAGNTGTTYTSTGACGFDIEVVGQHRGDIQLEILGSGGTGSNIYSGKAYTNDLNLKVTPTPATKSPNSVSSIMDTTNSSSASAYSTVSAPGGSPGTITASQGSSATTSFATPFSGATSVSVDLLANASSTLTLANVSLFFQKVPEPGSLALFATGLIGLAGIRRRFTRRSAERVVAES